MSCILFQKFPLQNGKSVNVELSFRVFGQALGTAPCVLVNHALTGNSEVAGENGWWKSLIGENKAIDTKKFTVLAFDIPGNGQTEVFIDNYKDYMIKDIAHIFLKGLRELKVDNLHALIGGSLGGAIAWEMAFQKPDITQFLIPIATDFKSSDWIIGQCHIQENILKNSRQPIQDARQHAMFLYRTPASMNQRFQNNKKGDLYKVQDWLNYHGKALESRFSIKAYLLMNHLLKTINVCGFAKDLASIKAQVHIVSVDSDLYFTHQRSVQTFKELNQVKKDTFLHTIESVHGHDAFLMEYKQLSQIIHHIF